MNIFKRLRGEDKPSASAMPYYRPFPIRFPDGATATAVRVPQDADASRVIAALGFAGARCSLLITGGASFMNPEDSERTRPMMDAGIARFADAHNVAVFDGGTDSGVMRLIGAARREHGYRFPLVGVAPIGVIRYPESDNPDGEPLDSRHSYFVLMDGDRFGQESPLLAGLTRTLADERDGKAVGVLINGGEVAREEIYQRALAPHISFPLIVLEGSGRFADDLAGAKMGKTTSDFRIPEILKRSEVRVVSVGDGPKVFYERLEQYLG